MKNKLAFCSRSCDEGYFGDICTPASVLPCELIDDFNDENSGQSGGIQVIKRHSFINIRGFVNFRAYKEVY